MQFKFHDSHKIYFVVAALAAPLFAAAAGLAAAAAVDVDEAAAGTAAVAVFLIDAFFDARRFETEAARLAFCSLIRCLSNFW